jgi:hypothetical protein
VGGEQGRQIYTQGEGGGGERGGEKKKKKERGDHKIFAIAGIPRGEVRLGTDFDPNICLCNVDRARK